MTDEERQRQILQRLAQLGTIGFHDPDIACQWILDGHDEIKRLVAENKELKKTLHHFLRERETDMGTAE